MILSWPKFEVTVGVLFRKREELADFSDNRKLILRDRKQRRRRGGPGDTALLS